MEQKSITASDTMKATIIIVIQNQVVERKQKEMRNTAIQPHRKTKIYGIMEVLSRQMGTTSGAEIYLAATYRQGFVVSNFNLNSKLGSKYSFLYCFSVLVYLSVT